jgi:hypothetical protein
LSNAQNEANLFYEGEPVMSEQQSEKPVKWYRVFRPRLTVQYVAGLISGFGFGIALIGSFKLFTGWSLPFVAGLLLMPIGQAILTHAQKR